MLFKCTKCSIEKPLDDFVKTKKNKRGRTSICKECTNSWMREYKKTYRQTEKYKASRKKYWASERYRAWQREYKRTPMQREHERKYRKAHKMSDDSRIKMNQYRARRYQDSHMVRINHSMAVNIGKSLAGMKNGRKWESLVGYTASDLAAHLERQFDGNMSWDNYGSYWHIDHKIPKSIFRFSGTNDEQFMECWALENLQPMEASENLRKNNKAIYSRLIGAKS